MITTKPQITTPSPSKADDADFSPERLTRLAGELSGKVSAAIKQLTNVNEQTRLLSLNAQIEAARAGGSTGAAFGVVAQAIQQLSQRTDDVAGKMATEINGAATELNTISQTLATNVRGTRLADLALVNIDLIDRCLYERTCDVRWWATDSSLVDAAADPTPQKLGYASKRMGVILSAYTVYFDLVLADLSGKIVANGRPDLYRSQGADVKDSVWFRSAMQTASGNEFGFESCHASPLVNNKRVLIYSCTVREGGEASGKVIGVLGIVFNWDSLAQTIVHNTPLPPEEKKTSRVCIIDGAGTVLADSHDRQLQEPLVLQDPDILKQKRGFVLTRHDGAEAIVAHAQAPGFETYCTGWHSLVIQKLAA